MQLCLTPGANGHNNAAPSVESIARLDIVEHYLFFAMEAKIEVSPYPEAPKTGISVLVRKCSPTSLTSRHACITSRHACMTRGHAGMTGKDVFLCMLVLGSSDSKRYPRALSQPRNTRTGTHAQNTRMEHTHGTHARNTRTAHTQTLARSTRTEHTHRTHAQTCTL